MYIIAKVFFVEYYCSFLYIDLISSSYKKVVRDPAYPKRSRITH